MPESRLGEFNLLDMHFPVERTGSKDLTKYFSNYVIFFTLHFAKVNGALKSGESYYIAVL